MAQGWMEMLKQRLMGGGQSAPPAPPPTMPAGKPWEQPLTQPPPAPMAQPMQQPLQVGPPPDAIGNMPGQPASPMDEALLLALAKKRFNQQVSGATGNPIPR